MLRIRVKRQELGMSQAELAKKVHVNQTAVSQWERGVVTPSLENAKRLSDAFSCTIDELYAEDKPQAM